MRGNFPPVHRLFKPAPADAEKESVDMVGLDPRYLASMQHLVGYKGEPLVFSIPKPGEKKHSPMLVSNVAGTARALLQPNLLITGAAEWKGEEIPTPAAEVKVSVA